MVRYHFPIALLARRIPSFLIGQHRSLAQDIDHVFRAIDAAPQVINPGFIPAAEPFVLVMNHFQRSDIPSWWIAMAVLKATAEHRSDSAAGSKLRVIVASQWTYRAPLQRLIAEPLTRFMVGRIARAYDFLTIEPIALGASAATARARSMRRILSAANAASRTHDVLCLAPEGGDAPDGALVHPPAGAGRFMLMLASAGLRFLPVGAYADADALIAAFGEPFQLSAPSTLRKSTADEWAAEQVMSRIAALLPFELRGAYRSHVEPIAAS
jgi:hypothetical protein